MILLQLLEAAFGPRDSRKEQKKSAQGEPRSAANEHEAGVGHDKYSQ